LPTRRHDSAGHGNIQLRVVEARAGAVVTEVIDGGILTSGKGVNFPGARLRVPAMTAKDEADLRFGIEHGVDCVALSFVRGAGDLRLLRQKMAAAGGAVPVVAKIEKPEAVEHLSEILDECDGAMIARGDLGVEMSPEDVPIVQKRIIRECRNRGIFVITATQMLESMLHSPLPTRAEASDVANAIFDGTDAVMLSGETAVGEYPIQSVEMMARIGVRAENESLDRAASFSGVQDRCPFLGVAPMMGEGASSVTEAAADAACAAAHALGARLIAAFTMTGSTAAMLSRRRPKTPIVAFSPVGATSRSMCFRHGVQPLEAPIFESTDEMIERAEAVLLERGLVSSGDTIVCVAGASTGTPGGTNLVKLHKLP